MNQEIVDYVIAAQRHGLTDFEIKQNLLNAGWEAQDVDQGFAFAKSEENKAQPGSPHTQGTAPSRSTFSDLNTTPVELPHIIPSVQPNSVGTGKSFLKKPAL